MIQKFVSVFKRPHRHLEQTCLAHGSDPEEHAPFIFLILPPLVPRSTLISQCIATQ